LEFDIFLISAVLPFIGIAFEILLLVLIDLAETIAEQVGAERHIEKTAVEQAAIVQDVR
jgi:hypothetical protein